MHQILVKKIYKSLIGSDLVINQVYEALNQFNWTEQQLLAYEQKKRVWDNASAERYQRDLIKQKTDEIKAEGKAERNIEIAKNVLSKNYSISDISAMTSLSPEAL